MPRQRTHHSRRTYVFPDDFPQRLVPFKERTFNFNIDYQVTSSYLPLHCPERGHRNAEY